MNRILLILVFLVAVLPAPSYGQDWYSSYDDPLSGVRSAPSASTGNPLPQTEFALNDAMFFGDNVERFDWLNLERPEGSIEFDDFIVRGQGEANKSAMVFRSGIGKPVTATLQCHSPSWSVESSKN
jgi:hypothetical protein